MRNLLEARSRLLQEIRLFFLTRSFLEVDTPLLVQNPGSDVHLDAFAVASHNGAHAGHLITSPEYQMKRLLCAGSGPIFQLGKCFRSGELGRMHEPEFTMLEWYRPNAGWNDVMNDTEELVATLAASLGVQELHTAKGSVSLTRPWPRVSVDEVFRRHTGKSCFEVSDEEFFERFAFEIDPHLGSEEAMFLVDWPAHMASLARIRERSAPPVAERFEAYIGGAELCNGFGELVDADELARRCESDRQTRERLGKTVYPDDIELIEAQRKGMPESGGNALGVDRLLMLLLGKEKLADVIPLPHAVR